MPLARSFNEVVAMDLKKWKNGLKIVYLIEIFTRYTLAQLVPSKDPEVNIDKVMLMWIGSDLGAPEKFLAENRGEFANEKYKGMCENLNIQVWNTVGQSPWQNGLWERNHAVVDRCLEKILEDNPDKPIDMALAWAVNAKNSLQMWLGYSSYQLVFGQNPNIPGVMTDKPSALEGSSTSEAFAMHMNTLCAAKQAFVQTVFRENQKST